MRKNTRLILTILSQVTLKENV